MTDELKAWSEERAYERAKEKYEEKLDKIRAEIVELWKNEPCAIEGGCLDEVIDIIDKYKAEKEAKK